jgi:hypothetical protein
MLENSLMAERLVKSQERVNSTEQVNDHMRISWDLLRRKFYKSKLVPVLRRYGERMYNFRHF